MAPLRHSLGVAVSGAVLALLAGCTSSSTPANPTTSNLITQSSVVTDMGTSPSASTSSAAPSSASTSRAPTTPPSTSPSAITPSSPKPTKTATSTKSTAPPTGPWPANLTSAQVKDAKAALASYVAFYQVVDRSYATPHKNWTGQVSQFSADPVKTSLLQTLTETAKLGQTGTGTTVVIPKVTKVQTALVTLTVCVDTTKSGLLDKSGKSIKAPDVSGSYWRYVSSVQVGEYVGQRWLVTIISNNWAKTC